MVKIINNYFSIGVDAKIAHDFHTFREQKPELCASRVGYSFMLSLRYIPFCTSIKHFHNDLAHLAGSNKLWYALSGVRAMFEPSNSSLASHIVLEADGKRITVGHDIQVHVLLFVFIIFIYLAYAIGFALAFYW